MANMNNYQSAYKDIISRLKSARSKETNTMLLSGLFKSAAVAGTALLIASAVEWAANGDTLFRTILALLSLLSILTAVGIFSLPALVRIFGKKNPSIFDIAIRVGDFYPDVKDKLCNAIQLLPDAEKPIGSSSDLIYASFDIAAKDTNNKSFDVIIEKKDYKRSLILLAVVLLFSVSLFTFFPGSLGSALNRVVNFNESYLPPAPFSLSISPEESFVLRGNSVKISISAEGKAPETVVLYIKEINQENYDSFKLKLDSGNVYNYTIPSAKKSIEFYAAAEWFIDQIKTKNGKITVIDKPIIKSISGKIHFPAYAAQQPKNIDEQNADVSALKGSTVEINIFSNKELSSAQIVYQKFNSVTDTANIGKRDTSIIKMSLNGKKATGSFKVFQSGSYHIELKDKDMQTNQDPVDYAVSALSDDYPSISLITPNSDVEIGDNALLAVKTAVSDDYGFSSLKLYYKLVESKYASPDKNYKAVNIPIVSKSNSQDIPFMWDMNKLGISPEDKYEFYLEVTDNDAVSGGKIARTQTLSVRLPSINEVIKQADDAQDKVQKDLEKTLKESENLKKQMEELNRELLKKKDTRDLDWKQKKQVEDIMKKQQELRKQMDQSQESLAETTKKLQEKNMLSPETLQKYMELQKLMQEVKSEDLERMQKKMEDAMQNMSPEMMQKAMENAKFDEEKFKKSIERTMKILKRIQAEQKTDALTKRAQELEEKQKSLDKAMENANSSDKEKRDEFARKQEQLKEEADNISKDLKNLEDLMKEIGENEMPMKEMQDAKDALEKEELSKDMQQSEQSAKEGDFNKSRQAQKRAAQKMNKFAKQMQKLKQEMQNKNSKLAQQALQKAINDILELSKNQEKLKNTTSKADYNSTQIPDLARKQGDLFEEMMGVANQLMELGNKTFAVTPQMGAEMGNSLEQMKNALDNMANRRMAQAAQAQILSMQAMNNAVGQMQSKLSEMKNKSNGSCDNPGGMGEGDPQSDGMSFQQRLQQLAGEQQAINQSMQQMSGTQNGGQMSREQQAEMGKLADKQGKAQKSMQDLADEQKKFVDGKRQALGSLDKIAQEMKEVLQDIKSGNITPETLQRQEKILSRLLDATKSMNDRDYEKTRESTTGKDYSRKSPSALDLNSKEGRNKALQELLRSAREGYTKDYEQLIRRYFEALQIDSK